MFLFLITDHTILCFDEEFRFCHPSVQMFDETIIESGKTKHVIAKCIDEVKREHISLFYFIFY